MAEESARTEGFEISCILCGRPLTEEDEIHFTFGPYGLDFDVICAECVGRAKQAEARGAATDGGSADESASAEGGNSFDLSGGLEWPDSPDA